jgi:hypothetical protein
MALRGPRSKKKVAGGCLTLVAVIVALLLAGELVDAVFNPWAHSWRGRPTLTGTWTGTITTPAGQRRGLFLDLRRSRKRRGGYSTCRHCPRIEGAARTCAGGGEQSYEVWGGPDTWGGERFHLKTAPPANEHDAPRLGYLSGEWAGDLLRLASAYEEGGAGGGLDAGGETRIEMRRGGEADFAALCRKLGAG